MRDWPRAAVVVAMAVVVGIGGVLALEAVTGFRPGAAPSAGVAEAPVTEETADLPTPSQPTEAPSTAAAPRGTTTPVPTVRLTAPTLPKAVKIAKQGCSTGREPDGTPSGECRMTVTWKEGATQEAEIRVYGVTKCLSAKRVAGGGSCLAVNTPLPAGSLELITKAAESDGKVSWTRPAWQDLITPDTGGPRFWTYGVDGDGNDIYYAIVVAAYNSAGHSKFVIADNGTWCYDTGCEGP